MLGYKSRRQFLLIYGGIFTMSIIGFIVRLTKFDEFGLRAQISIYLISLVLATSIWESLRLINRKLDIHYPYERGIGQRITIQLLLGGCVGLLARLFIYYFGEPNLPFKLDSLFIATTWFLYFLLPCVINLGFIANYFFGRWRDSLVMNERLEKEKAYVQFDNLKNQLNPHFLFNALTSLNSLINENQELASQFVQQLSKVYRYVLQNKEKSYVLLKTELDFIQHYISLLRTRFQNALIIKCEIEPITYDLNIVPVTIQILIENAVKHNVIDKDRPLTIDIYTSGDYLVVSNNVQLRTHVETSNKVGLDNMKSLYQFLTERPVIIEENEERFSVKIPLV